MALFRHSIGSMVQEGRVAHAMEIWTCFVFHGVWMELGLREQRIGIVMGSEMG